MGRRLDGRVVLITGVSRRIGIGAAIAREVARQGARLFCSYFRPYDRAQPWSVAAEEPERIAAELRATGCEVETREVDLADPAAADALVAAAIERFGTIDVLVNNAAHSEPGELAYVATKGGIDASTSSLGAELAHRGITVDAVDPGATDTGWMPDALRESLVRSAPMGRVSAPEDAARLVAFLASDDAAWITGQVIRSRGGS